MPANEAEVLIALGALAQPDETVEVPGLIGCDHLPALLVIGERQLAAGDVVRAAFERSDLTVEAWNALPADDRQAWCDGVVAVLQLNIPTPKPDDATPPAAVVLEQGIAESPTVNGAAAATVGAAADKPKRKG